MQLLVSLSSKLSSLRGIALSLCAVFLTVFGSKLWLVSRYGNDVPFWDQWNGEGALVYKPLLEHGIEAISWFSPHNEHRIFLARVTGAIILYLNKQWDPLVEMCWEAFCAGFIAVLLCTFVSRLQSSGRNTPLLWIVILLGMSLPFGWENSLAGFQISFYYIIFFSLVVIYLSTSSAAVTFGRAAVICGVGLLSLFTLASGSITCLAGAACLLVRTIDRREQYRGRLASVSIVLLLLAIWGFVITPRVPHHEVLRAQSFGVAWHAFYLVISWPNGLGIVTWIPFILFLAKGLRQRCFRTPDQLFVFGLGLFVLLNAAAIATARATTLIDSDLESRYTDIAWLTWLVNIWSLSIITQALSSRFFASHTGRVVAVFFVYACCSLVTGGFNGLPGAVDRSGLYAVESSNTRDYVLNGNLEEFLKEPLLRIPFPIPATLAQYLDDPTMRTILPPGIRPGILSRSHASLETLQAAGFQQTGVPPLTHPAPPPYIMHFFGSFTTSAGFENTAKYVGPVLKAEGAYLRTNVSGYLGKGGLSLFIEDPETGERVVVAPKHVAADNWESVLVKIPGDHYRLVAEDTVGGREGWFAFTDPVEIGRLRPLADRFVSYGLWMCVIGLFLFIASIASSPRRLDELS